MSERSVWKRGIAASADWPPRAGNAAHKIDDDLLRDLALERSAATDAVEMLCATVSASW